MKKSCDTCAYSINCPTGKDQNGESKTFKAKYKSAGNLNMCRKTCQKGWFCSREIGHDGPHEAHKNHKEDCGALACWVDEPVNENLLRLR